PCLLPTLGHDASLLSSLAAAQDGFQISLTEHQKLTPHRAGIATPPQATTTARDRRRLPRTKDGNRDHKQTANGSGSGSESGKGIGQGKASWRQIAGHP